MTVLIDFHMKDGRDITIRSYTPEHFEALVSMFQRLSKEALRYGFPPYDRPRLERWVSGLDSGILLLAFDGENIVGVATMWSSWKARLKGVGEFARYTHQDYHGEGLGTFLARKILEEAKRKGFHRVTLHVVVDNTPAIKAYENAGFVHEGPLKDAFVHDDGRYHDQLVMGIIL